MVVVSITEPVNEDTFAAALAKAVIEVMDEWFSKGLSVDVKRGFLKVLEDGWYPWGSKLPYGYSIENVAVGKSTRRRLEINNEEVDY